MTTKEILRRKIQITGAFINEDIGAATIVQRMMMIRNSYYYQIILDLSESVLYKSLFNVSYRFNNSLIAIGPVLIQCFGHVTIPERR